ncbi:UNVERIFIED_CONTAM: hypothetical protein PYX00_006002 [Menopon gallinae]|uniref:Mitochondrial inner membrane protease subunit n=1 Tax=Menopon gallinae TaxID=328185 RepID=A0AAW2HTQ4_9NEOP
MTMAVSHFRKHIAKIAEQILHVALVIGALHMCSEYFYGIAVCVGNSMEPTMKDNDIILLNKRNKYSPQRGDIVIIRSPNDPMKLLCKRVIHLPGDMVSRQGYRGTLPQGKIWLEGDNYEHSNDSRVFGPVPKGLIIGKVTRTLWPHFTDLRNS